MSRFLPFSLVLFSIVLFQSCSNKQAAELILYNATIYTVDSTFSMAQSVAIRDGKIMAVGTNEEIASAYHATRVFDLQGKPMYPGFIDAHCHFYGAGIDLKKIDLYGTKSFDDVLKRVVIFRSKTFSGWIFGRGWDQNDWLDKQYPEKHALDSLFPDTPVFLMRIDGHAALVNQKALDIAGFTSNTHFEGGEVVCKDGKPTGLLIDNAAETMVKFVPEPSLKDRVEALLSMQKKCFAAGLTTVDDAGIDYRTVLLMDSLQQVNRLKMRVYAMISYDSVNTAYFFKHEKIKTPYLNARAFKVYGDGALGSRGACLLAPYSDKNAHSGFLLHNEAFFQKAARELLANEFQMNTHCIGDSANRLLLNVYSHMLKGKNDLRWRIEHAQVVDPKDLTTFAQYGILPSVQPTHATSDMYWAGERLGAERIQTAYAYKDLLKQNGKIALGTDFPVEQINPLLTFYAAVTRKDLKGYPDSGFQSENALTREEALRGMTCWAAFANFEEHEKGSIEPGKFADFVVLDQDIMKIDGNLIPKTNVFMTFSNGEEVYHAN